MSSPSLSSPRRRDVFGLPLAPPHRWWRGPGAFECSGWCRRLRRHNIGLEEFLEEWYDRSAETCDLFDNISQVDRYSVTCTVCRHFEKQCCSPDLRGPGILILLRGAVEHDGAAWEPPAGVPLAHHHCL